MVFGDGNGFNVLVTPFYKPLAVCSGKVLAFIKYNISVLSECYGNPPVFSVFTVTQSKIKLQTIRYRKSRILEIKEDK